MPDLLFSDRLIVNQKAKIVEVTNQYLIRDDQGEELGYMQQEGQSTFRKVLRFATDVDQFLTHRLALYDTSGSKLLQIVRPAKIFKSKFSVEDGNGNKLGAIAQRNVFGKIGFDLLDTGGRELGRIQAENWRAWDFAIVDAAGNEIGRIDKVRRSSQCRVYSGRQLHCRHRSRTHRGASLADDRSGDRRGHSPDTRRARLQRYRRLRVRSSTSRRCSCDVDYVVA
ncbi:MAG: phospholipid scramblase-related protein [Actinomycetota bacterium]